ncbi:MULTISPECIES: TolC family protein [Bacteroidota]|jgi:outer membrane protein TolC|uniref:Transporter n=3 Tax=Bacteroidota TaxID=976 RepID=A0A0J7LRR1_9FLAO|nr:MULTISPECIES: TolC family protein [Bacteroidota]AZA56525.1 TolC family protein [Chryseobacterium shandongense]KMQ71695.1 transporter [Chryseobacterium koreense CCUG 49689]MBB5333174.1 outer membrane protein TolC [Chryseobacterium koreense]QQV03019.1 TolC family protein [Chryseobacterium sp. FDAARGOS 1104]VFB03692.1 type I secretion outer membrane protein, TolC family [Chryseobacterium taihuense]
MKINSIALLVACLWVANAEAQSGLETILTDISKNNKTLQSQSKYWEAQKLQFKTGNTLYDPTISYDYMRGTPSAVAGNQTDISVIQRFDFPTVYGKKKNLANEKSKQGDFALLATKQDILLEAKKSAIELIYRNKLQEKIKERKTKTEKFLSDFQTKLNRGEGNILDVNKAKLQLIEINKDLKLNTSSINQLQQKLTELNGGIDVIFNESEYPEVIAIPSFEELEEIIEAQDPTRKLLQQQTTIAQQQIQVTKAMALPKFEAGYHYQGILGQNFHGARIGMSIPLWENKNRVKQSMAELEMNEVQLNEHKVEHYYNIKSLYEKYTNLQKTLDEYQTVLESINSIQLLDKALRFGEITTIQYFLEASYYYQASNNYLLTEKEYQDVIAELLKYQL